MKKVWVQLCEVQTDFGIYLPARFTKKFLGAFLRCLHLKTKLFAVKFSCTLEVLSARFTVSLQGLQKKLWVHFHDSCVQKLSCFMPSSDAFQKFSPARFIKKFLGALSRFLCSKTKLFAVKFRCILEALHIQDFQKDFWVHFHNLCVQKQSCFL